MAEQNMWKKQMLANKNKPDTKPEPPKVDTTANNAPPWAKNNQVSTPALNNWVKNAPPPANSNDNQPPWAKSNSSTTPAATSNTPAWMKPKEEAATTNTAANSNTPAWMKPKEEAATTNTAANSNTPAWMKPKEEAATTNTAANSNTPAWMKPKEESSPNPPWAKQNQNASSPSPAKPTGNPPTQSPAPSQPAWMKNNSATESSPPPWANKNAGSSSPQPSWANKGPAQSGQTAPNPPWMKSGESPAQTNQAKMQKIADMEKEKKEMEERQRQLEEEEKERKRQERLKREKEEEERNIERELREMQAEDDLSAQRQRHEKEEIERIERERKEREEREAQEREAERQRLEKEQAERERAEKERVEREEKEKERVRLESEQRTRLENERVQLERLEKSKSRSGRKSRRGLESSKISHISSIRAVEPLHSSSLNAFDPSQPENLFHRTTRLLNEEAAEPDYREKIAIQRALLLTQLQFRRDCEAEIVELVRKRKVTNRRRKVVFSNSMQIRYGLCEGRREGSGVSFVEEEGERLRAIFLHYEALTRCVTGLLRKKINIHMRVPLLSLAEYKGVTFLLECLSPELAEINETDIGLFQEIANEVLILEKELELCYDARNEWLRPLQRSQLMVKKVSIYQEDYYVLYIKEETVEAAGTRKGKSAKAHPTPDLSYLRLIEFITGETELLPVYTPPLLPPHANTELYAKTATPACRSLLKQLSLANAIKTVYSSCQGEVEEGSFFELVLGENKEVWEMIVAAGFPSREPPSALSLAYLQRLAALRFTFTEAFFSRRQKSLVQAVRPCVYIQKHEFEMLQFVKNLEKYMGQGKEELVEESMRMNRELWEELERGEEEGVRMLRVKREVSYLLFLRREKEALALLEHAQTRLAPFAIENVSLSLLFIKIFIRIDAEVPLLKKLSELLRLLEFYFKEETIIHSYVYTVVGSYYSRKGDSENESKVVTFYEHALAIALKLYGEKAQEVGEVYLSRATAMLALRRSEAFQRDIAAALKIYKIHSKNNAKIAECNHLLGRVACLEGRTPEGAELMDSSSALFLKMENYVESLNVSFELLRFVEGDEGRYEAQLERIIEVCFRYKSVRAFQRAVRLLLDRELHCYTSLTVESLAEACPPEKDRSGEEILIDLEEEIRGFTSFIEIVRWSLSILAAKVLIRKEATSDYWKAVAIMRDVVHFYNRDAPQPESAPATAREAQVL